MKSNFNTYINEVLEGFRNNRGKASVYCYPPIDPSELVYNVIKHFYTKSPGEVVFIVVDGYKTRTDVIACINKHSKEDDIVYNIKVLSEDYIKVKYKYDYKLIITVGVNNNLEVITHMVNSSKFTLSVLTKNIMDVNYIMAIRDILPPINVVMSDQAAKADRMNSPVEEYRIPIVLNDEAKALYDKCTDYISTSISIFGDLYNIEKCKYGDTKLNISGSEFRDTVARNNGWSPELNTDIDFHKRIDDMYNPNVLFDRANTFYAITKQRKDILTDCFDKLVSILNICLDNPDKKILIVSKRGEYAALITKFINQNSELKCLDYHDCIDDCIAIHPNGEPILVKSGVNKGKPKVIGSGAISTSNLTTFNQQDGNVLSIKNSSNVKLKTAIDLIIFTTPYCNEIIDFKARFTDIDFKTVPNTIYKLYCIGTIEEKHLTKQLETPMIKVIQDETNFIEYDENNGDIIL